MTISVKCRSCGKKLKAPDSAAGKRAKCPGCGKAVKIPEPVYDAEEVDDGLEDYEDYGAGEDYGAADEEDYGFDGVDEYDSPAVEQRRPCPMCGEMIVSSAAKCRYCGEIFDATLKRKSKRKKKRRGSQSMPLANRGTRLVAQFLDGLATLGAIIPGMIIMFGGQELAREEPMVMVIGIILAVCGFLAFMIYQWALLANEGQTVGKRMMNIRIVMADDGSLPGFGRAVGMRLFVNGLIGAIPYLGTCYGLIDILFIFGDDRRCLHDLLAETIVVEA